MLHASAIDFIWTESELVRLDLWANLTLLGIATLIAYPFLQLALAWRYAGGWRILALLPVVITGPVILYTLWQIARSADLWFVASIYVMPPATLFLVVVAAAHWLAQWRDRRLA